MRRHPLLDLATEQEHQHLLFSFGPAPLLLRISLYMVSILSGGDNFSHQPVRRLLVHDFKLLGDGFEHLDIHLGVYWRNRRRCRRLLFQTDGTHVSTPVLPLEVPRLTKVDCKRSFTWMSTIFYICFS